jgi:hypothetical protein
MALKCNVVDAMTDPGHCAAGAGVPAFPVKARAVVDLEAAEWVTALRLVRTAAAGDGGATRLIPSEPDTIAYHHHTTTIPPTPPYHHKAQPDTHLMIVTMHLLRKGSIAPFLEVGGIIILTSCTSINSPSSNSEQFVRTTGARIVRIRISSPRVQITVLLDGGEMEVTLRRGRDRKTRFIV